MNINNTYFIAPKTPNKDAVLFVHVAAEDWIVQAVRFMSSNLSSSKKETVGVEQKGIQEYKGFPFEDPDYLNAVVRKLEHEHYFTELQFNAELAQYCAA